MRTSFLRAFQWTGIAVVLAALVGLNYDFESDANVQMNSAIEDPLSQGLLGYWKMDEGTGTGTTADASGNANTLSLTGPPTWTTGTIGPYALDFSGTGQYLSVADPASGVLDFADGASFSLTGWFNRDLFAADHTIIAKKNDQSTSGETGYIVWVDNGSPDTLCIAVYGTAGYTVCSTSDLGSSGWHHFAISWNDAVGVKIYIDGADNTGTPTGTFSSVASLANARAFTIGAESDATAGTLFDGKIDDVRVYGYALSADEVAKLAQITAPAQPVDTSLVGHWTFDGLDLDPINGTVKDRSMSGNNGTFTPAHVIPTIGKLGQAIHLDGTAWEYITLNSSTNLELGTGDMTITAWVKIDSTTSYDVVVFYKGDGGTEGYHAKYDGTLDRMSLNVSTGSENTWYNYEPSTSLKDDTWHMLTYVIDRDEGVSFYLDGAFGTTDGSSVYNGSDITNISQGVAIGSKDANTPLVTIDDLRVYKRALSMQEIQSLYSMSR